MLLDEKFDKETLLSYHESELASPPPASPKSLTYKAPTLWLVLLVLAGGIAQVCYVHVLSKTQTSISWSSCPDVTETECAYLSVPLDYSNPRANETVSLALRRLPATAPRNERLGSLFINPGGPGGSGTNFVVRAGQQLSVIVKGRYDILSWDPRSVNLTSPSLDCFETHGDAARFTRDTEQIGLPYDFRTEESFAANETTAGELTWHHKMDAFQVALDGACTTRANKLLLRASSTAFVVRDIVSILEALGERKLSYWGFSYGTILGATFAAMFPDLVHRAILDGTSDASLYTSDMLEWGRSGMDDTAKTYEGFLSSCAESGPRGCALAKGNDTAEALEKRLDALRHRLRSQPLSVPTSKVGPGIVTSSDVQRTIFSALYSPKKWPETARALSELEAGNGSLIYESANTANAEMERRDPLKNPFHRSMDSTAASTAAIMCSDTDTSTLADMSTQDVSGYFHELEQISPTGSIWAVWVTTCRRWTSTALEAYRGPWTVADGLRRTNFPLLFMSNTADPVTPLSAAKHMSLSFGNDSASLLIQTGFGHCSLAHPSLCTAKAARAYLLDGVVPKWGEMCHADPGFLFPHPSDQSRMEALGAEDAELTHALHDLAGLIADFSMRP